MLKHLHIKNYALIDSLSMELGEGFTVITGETGAGKSILLGALSLVLGQRADTRVLSDPEKKCIIEAGFLTDRESFLPLFETHQLDFEPETLVRREITPQGKSRAFINDTPVTLQVMREITGKLIDIHSQHQNLLLGETPFQFDVLDGYAQSLELRKVFEGHYREWTKAHVELRDLREMEKRSAADQDYFLFQYEELEKALPEPGEASAWEEELARLRNGESIKMGLEKTAFLLDGSEVNILDLLHDAIREMRALEQYGKDLGELADRLESVAIETRDIDRELQKLSGSVGYDPEQIRDLEQKTDLLNKLFLKHHVQDVESLVRLRNEYHERIQTTESLSGQIAAKEAYCLALEQKMMKKAGELSAARKQAAPGMEREVQLLLKDLGMPAARFRIALTEAGTPGLSGTDKLEFLFSANPGNEPMEISRIASGGELSRLMLSIKSLTSRKNLLSSIIFDEIDTGISGEIGGKIGSILYRISERMQVVAITHLPQIAARGSSHFQVYKTLEDGRTVTRIKNLGKNDRSLEIAKMLGGEAPTRSMVKTAEELMANNIKS
jgi:DNA repair protein RecN (Recombination protein N)